MPNVSTADCREKDLSQIIKIVAYGQDETQIPSPVFTCVNAVSHSDITLSGGTVVTFAKGSVSIDDSTNQSVVGRTHTVKLEYDMADDTADYSTELASLMHAPHTFVLTYFGGLRQMLRTSFDGYDFEVSNQDGHQHVTATLTNGQGITNILD